MKKTLQDMQANKKQKMAETKIASELGFNIQSPYQ